MRPAGRPTFWAILYRDNGSLEFLSLPDFTLKYVVLNFHMGEFRCFCLMKTTNRVIYCPKTLVGLTLILDVQPSAQFCLG